MVETRAVHLVGLGVLIPKRIAEPKPVRLRPVPGAKIRAEFFDEPGGLEFAEDAKLREDPVAAWQKRLADGEARECFAFENQGFHAPTGEETSSSRPGRSGADHNGVPHAACWVRVLIQSRRTARLFNASRAVVASPMLMP